MANILWIIAVILIALWVLGFLIHIAGMLIHLALLVAVMIIIYNLITGRKRLL